MAKYIKFVISTIFIFYKYHGPNTRLVKKKFDSNNRKKVMKNLKNFHMLFL